MISTQYIKLDMVPSGPLPILHMSQYDVGRPLGLVVYNNSAPVDLDTYTATIEGTRTDGTPITAAVTTDDEIGVFVTTATMTNEADFYKAKLVLVDSNTGRVSSVAFIMHVDPKTMDENAQSIEEDQSLYAQYTEAVQILIADIREDISDVRSQLIQHYDTVAQMQADTSIEAGMYARTGGYSALDDGGTGLYRIRTKNGSEATDAFNVIQMSDASLVAQLITSRTAVTNFKEFVDAINDGNRNSSYNCTEITIDSTITLTNRSQCGNKAFTNATFTLNADMFQWANMSDYFGIPSFVNCTFIGNGHNICADGAYILGGRFVNCSFIDCGLVKNGYFAQSQRFINCKIGNEADHVFIHCERVYDVKFIGCQVESDNKASLINAFSTTANRGTVTKVAFESCILEGQTSEIVIMHDGDIVIDDCYTESNTKQFVKVLASNFSSNGIFRGVVKNTRVNHTAGVDFVSLDSSYDDSSRTVFSCDACHISQCNLINTSNIKFFWITNATVESNGTRPPSLELSKISPSINTNSVASFTTGGHIIVKKWPCLITFDSNDGGVWHTNLYLVSLSYGNRPTVVCLSDQTKTPTAAYDANTDTIDVTMHTSSGSSLNRSAVLLNGILNDLNRNGNYVIGSMGY